MAANPVDFFLMANLSPLFTGLPFVVWISVRGNVRHGPRVKVSRGIRARPGQLISVAIAPEVRVIGREKLPPGELALLRNWVQKNASVLMRYWDGELFTEHAIQLLKPLSKNEGGSK